MSDHEDLYQEILDEDRGVAAKFQLSEREIELARKVQSRKEIDPKRAAERYAKEIAPVLERRRRAESGQSITGNKLKDYWLKMTGKDKIPDVEIVDPKKGISVRYGVTFEEARQAILRDPDSFRDLRKQPFKPEKS